MRATREGRASQRASLAIDNAHHEVDFLRTEANRHDLILRDDDRYRLKQLRAKVRNVLEDDMMRRRFPVEDAGQNSDLAKIGG